METPQALFSEGSLDHLEEPAVGEEVRQQARTTTSPSHCSSATPSGAGRIPSASTFLVPTARQLRCLRVGARRSQT
jgi:hypothetical protein